MCSGFRNRLLFKNMEPTSMNLTSVDDHGNDRNFSYMLSHYRLTRLIVLIWYTNSTNIWEQWGLDDAYTHNVLSAFSIVNSSSFTGTNMSLLFLQLSLQSEKHKGIIHPRVIRCVFWICSWKRCPYVEARPVLWCVPPLCSVLPDSQRGAVTPQEHLLRWTLNGSGLHHKAFQKC